MSVNPVQPEIADMLMKHQRMDAGHCSCGAGVETGLWGSSHAGHVANNLLPIFDKAQAAQPDRPEPVDPASVRIADFIDIEHEDGNWRAVGTVTGIYHYIFLVRVGVDDVPLSTKYATVRVLHPAEPEPDQAAVEALAEKVRLVRDHRNWGDDSDETLARELIRLGAYVEEASADE